MKKAIACFLALLMCFSCFSVISFAEETTGEHLTEVPEGYIGIYTKDELYDLRADCSGKYILMNDIVFDQADFEQGGGFYNSGKGWEPIGTKDTPFEGTFDGNNYNIKNLYICNTDNYAGLFGYVKDGQIQNVTLGNADITGADYTGGIAGYVKSTTITDCCFSGSVNGNDYVGGIVGYAYDWSTISRCSTFGSVSGNSSVGGIVGKHQLTGTTSELTFFIEECINAATVTGNDQTGGIAGYAAGFYYYNSSYGFPDSGASGTNVLRIEKCINTGDVNCTSDYAGGIVGYAATNGYRTLRLQYVSNCYNTADISGCNYVGGLVGFGEDSRNRVYNSYSVGTVVGETNFGGCFGNEPYLVEFCYYLDDAVTDATCLVGTAKSADQLVRRGTYEQWDFDTVWTMEGRADYPYPELCGVDLYFPGDDPDHEHSYVSSVTTPATHTTTGVITYTCACGDSYTEEIAKLEGHTYTPSVTKTPTHTEEGVMTYTCLCGDSYTEAIPTLEGHDYKAIVTYPTCEEGGYTTYKCICGDTYVSDYTLAMGHDYKSAVTTPATHTEKGVMTYTCHCGDSYTEEIEKLAAHNHIGAVTEPTCEEGGYTTYKCICGDTYISDYTLAMGHDYKSAVTTPATHTEEGVMTYTCHCGASYTETIAKTEKHSYTSEITVPSTHLATGVMTYTCICGDTYTEAIEKLAKHSYDESEVIKEATCKEDGRMQYTCECGESYTETIYATGHKDEDGDIICDKCGISYCSHLCHKSIFKILWKIINFFNKLFGINAVCECGMAHY